MSEIYFARLSSGALRTDESDLTLFSDGNYHLEARLAGSVTHHRSDDIIAVVSGIIYGEASERDEAVAPVERLVEAFRQGGAEAAAKLEGHFSAILIEPTKGDAYAFGDNRGGRRIFYSLTENGNGFIVATKLRPVADGLPLFPGADKQYQPFNLVYGYAPLDRTVYEGVRRLEASQVLAIEQAVAGFIERETPGVPEREARMEKDEAKRELYERLIASTASIVEGHKRVGVFLGGFDSALVAALAKRAGAEVFAFTFSYADAGFNQRNIDSVVEALDIEHHWVPITSESIGDGLANFADRFDRPTNWPNYVIQTAALAQVAREKDVSLLLTGDGCDEIFLGYPGIYRGSKFFNGEKTASRVTTGLAHGLLTHAWVERSLGHVYRLLHRIIRNRALPARTRLYLMFRVMDESTLSHLFGWPVKRVEQQVTGAVREVEGIIPDVSPTVLAYEGRDHIVPNRLKISGVMDTSGLPVATPYMHPLMRDFVRRIPEELLRPDGEAKRTTLGKDILLQTADEAGLLPHEVIYQPKHAAVDGPLDKWYATDLRDLIKDLIREIGPIASERNLDAIVDEKWIEKFYRKHFSVDSITSHAASLLATYGSFQKKP